MSRHKKNTRKRHGSWQWTAAWYQNVYFAAISESLHCERIVWGVTRELPRKWVSRSHLSRGPARRWSIFQPLTSYPRPSTLDKKANSNNYVKIWSSEGMKHLLVGQPPFARVRPRQITSLLFLHSSSKCKQWFANTYDFFLTYDSAVTSLRLNYLLVF